MLKKKCSEINKKNVNISTCCIQVSSVQFSRSVVSDSLQPLGLESPWTFPGQNPGVGSLSFSRGSSQPRDRTQVSRIAGRFFTA